MKRKLKILVCPLNWGLGHATRDVPLINLLKSEGHEVIIAADERPYSFLKREFPEIKIIRFPGIKIKYSKSKFLAPTLLIQLPRLIFATIKEHLILKKIIRDEGIDLVISDNRFGAWSKNKPSIFITHQIRLKPFPKLKFIEAPMFWINRHIINKYDEIWIPDLEEGQNLSGSLTHHYKLKTPRFFIGPLSRFNNNGFKKDEDIDLLAIVSGPEPQRSIFENIIIEQTKNTDLKVVILRGKTESLNMAVEKNIRLLDHIETPYFQSLIQNAKAIICKSGYCTLLDLAIIGKPAILVPTPGQTEQIYLARKLSRDGIHYSSEQSDLNILNAINEVKKFTGIKINQDYSALKERIRNLHNL